MDSDIIQVILCVGSKKMLNEIITIWRFSWEILVKRGGD